MSLVVRNDLNKIRSVVFGSGQLQASWAIAQLFLFLVPVNTGGARK